ncbi:stage II sporulation protein D [Paenibacillus sp. SN-8-1]|uniref:stage II sporulation protein D n=1 Tax=Paenibacillus sp. SN-8-1 TaxID=3435409 RepID=UPI003D9A410B
MKEKRASIKVTLTPGYQSELVENHLNDIKAGESSLRPQGHLPAAVGDDTRPLHSAGQRQRSASVQPIAGEVKLIKAVHELDGQSERAPQSQVVSEQVQRTQAGSQRAWQSEAEGRRVPLMVVAKREPVSWSAAEAGEAKLIKAEHSVAGTPSASLAGRTAHGPAAAPAGPSAPPRAPQGAGPLHPPGVLTPPGAIEPPRTRVRVRGMARDPFFRRFGRKDRQILAAAAVLTAAALVLPALVTLLRGGHSPGAVPQPAPVRVPAKPVPAPAGQAQADKTPVRVYLSKTGAVETLPLEEYVAGVLAAEMPATFELEALKAQAIAARTFIVHRLVDGDVSGVPGGAANVTDTVAHQAYLSRAALTKWKTDGEADKLAKIKKAVQDTSGTIMTYQGKPITASFFSASSGYTENSEEYWNQKIPYLRSVASPWDAKLDPTYKETVSMKLSSVFHKLGLSQPSVAVSTQSGNTGNLFKILSSTTGHRVKEAEIGGSKFSGREIREKLGLRSSQFRFDIAGDQVKITTYGYGHGVGMSQWGANGMAREGYTVTQILRHYYTGISFDQASRLLPKG